MIAANELRINNWVNIDTGTEDGILLGRVVELRERLFLYFDFKHNKIFGWGYLATNPIPLTPEILEKCGFVKGAEDFWMYSGLEININDIEDVIMDGFGHIEVRFLHQLQNLFFALTGTELQVNLSEPVLSK